MSLRSMFLVYEEVKNDHCVNCNLEVIHWDYLRGCVLDERQRWKQPIQIYNHLSAIALSKDLSNECRRRCRSLQVAIWMFTLEK